MFQVYTTVPSLLQCWGLCWSLPCWQEQPGLHIRRTPCVFGGFPPSAAFITDSLEHIETQTEMCWLLTWVHILDNSTQRLLFLFSFFFFISCYKHYCEDVPLHPRYVSSTMTENLLYRHVWTPLIFLLILGDIQRCLTWLWRCYFYFISSGEHTEAVHLWSTYSVRLRKEC